MSRSGQERLFEGWLTKSPPIKRIWRGRWRKRWFSLQHSGELPGQYVLIYYADRNCRKIKGIIDLDHCEQVDTGLKFEDKKIKFDYLFDIKTPPRTYYLAAETEQEMKTWVKYICSVCGLKGSSDEEEVNILQDIENKAKVKELNNEVPLNETISTNNLVQSPPVSPVSTSPYIPISECISGSSSHISAQGIKGYQALLQQNLRNSFFRSTNFNNETYEPAFGPTYLNFNCGRSYDIPRLLQPPPKGQNILKLNEEANYQNLDKINPSPLQSPTDSENVFTDSNWQRNFILVNEGGIPIHHRPSESSVDSDASFNQKFNKLSVETIPKEGETLSAPPRPPKPSHINLNQFVKEKKNSITSEDKALPIWDEMYDFPRSLHNDFEVSKKRHCYNNAAPVSLDGQIFRYDISPKPGTSGTQIFRYDEENLDEPTSPLSHSSSTHAYSNLPSPLLPDSQIMPPPIVNRGLKPKRKLSDSLSISSNPEQPSPRSAPSVDRNLKPVLLSPKIKQNSLNSEDESSNDKLQFTPTFHRSYDSVFESDQIVQYINRQKLEYLDLDLDITTQFTRPAVVQVVKPSGANTVYKEVDFTKTIAFNITRNNLEKERKETVAIQKK